MFRRMVFLPVVLLTMPFLASCGEEEDSLAMLSVEFAVEDQFGVEEASFVKGDTANLVFTLRNKGSSSITVYYTPPMENAIARRVADDSIVWDYNYGKFFIQAFVSFEIPAGSEERVVIPWDFSATPELADDVPAGLYDIEPDFSVQDKGGSSFVTLDADDAVRVSLQ
ncbi:MAG: BsuPI-related putative proteinase inhibitor [Gammaproteobacteria bacterium]|nr:BsuPI-related putative proteinase inhibitor [Gammaproteobacteria bacterium]